MQMDGAPIFWSGIVQGLGTGIAFVPMAALAFATLPADLRNEGTAMFSLIRNIGSSIGISVVQALLVSNTQVLHSSLAEHISPYNLAARNPELAAQLSNHVSTAALNATLTAQASMIAYIDDFQLMFILTLTTIPLLLLVRIAKTKADSPHVAVE
jgi:DHA2 family multidrug resistance protein